MSDRHAVRNALYALATGFILTGCLSEEVATDTNPNARLTSLSGSVGDGPLVGATVTVIASDGTELGTIQSDSSASFRINLTTQLADYPLTVEARGGTDLVTGLAPDFVLRSTVTQTAADTTVNANPFSTVIYELATLLPAGMNDDTVASAEQIVIAELNSGLVGLEVDGPILTVIDASNIADIVRASEALGEIVRRTRDLHTQFSSGIDGDGVIVRLAADLPDSVVDGRGAANADARVAALSTVVSAQVLLEAMANELHVNGSDASEAMRMATETVSSEAPNPGIDELPVTSEALERIRIGLAAAYEVTQDAAIADLHASVSGMQAGMSAVLVRGLLPANYRQRLDAALLTVANGNDAVLEAVNAIARNRTTTITVAQNNPPQIDGTPPASVAVGASYSFTPQASDADGDALTFSISGRPPWAAFDTATGALSGTPTVAVRHDNIVISVSDGEATAMLPAFSIDVFIENRAPQISGTPQTSLSVGEAWSFTPDAADPDGDTLSFSVQNAPSWTSFDPATGALSGTPQAGDAGTYADITVSVSDGTLSDSLVFTLQVSTGNQAPVISGTPPASVVEGQSYSFVPGASDPDGDPLTFSVANRPSWASFDPATGALNGTPQPGDAGQYANIRITVSDGSLSATLTFSIEVIAANSVPEIFGNPPSTVAADETYTFRPTATDADGDTLTFSVSNLPSWASFNPANGEISGTPGSGDTGTWAGISITVSDGQDNASLGPFSIEVLATATATGSVTLSWTPPSTNDDGSTLTDLVGYRIYWGTTPGVYPNSVTIDNPSISTYVIDDLAPGTYEFVATSINSMGLESEYSNLATKTIP